MAYYCLFNDEARFVLCVDPKCGCTTIKTWFAETVRDAESTESALAQIGTFMRLPHAVREADDYTKVWIVRDPLRRLVSFYYQFIVRTHNDLWRHADAKGVVGLEGCTFEDFVRIIGDLHQEGERLQHHLEPQTRALTGVRFDAIVKIEELSQRADELMELLGVDVRPGHHNKQPVEATHEPSAFRLTPEELKGRPPLAFESFWDTELTSIARWVYAEDCEFYDGL